MEEKNIAQNAPKSKREKFDFKKFCKGLFVNNYLFKLSAIFLGVLLWLFLGYLRER